MKTDSTTRVFLILFAVLGLAACGGGGGGGGGGTNNTGGGGPPAGPWTQQLGTTSPDEAFGVATDAAGNVYMTGYTAGGLDGNVNAGSTDLVVVKYSANGNKLWTKQLGSTPIASLSSGSDVATGIATDTDGSAYVTGHTYYAGLDGNTSAGGWDLFVVKYDTSGAKLWTRQLGTAMDDVAFGIATDAVGNVYVTGRTDAGLDGNPYAGGYDLFVVKYDTNGNKLWTKQLGTDMDDVATGIAIAAGTVYVAGHTESGLDGNTHAGAYDLFVVKFAAQGKPCSPIPVFPPCEVQPKLWTRQLGTAMDDVATGIATDADGNAYVTGYTAGSLDGNTSAGEHDLFVVKYDANGVKQ